MSVGSMLVNTQAVLLAELDHNICRISIISTSDPRPPSPPPQCALIKQQASTLTAADGLIEATAEVIEKAHRPHA